MHSPPLVPPLTPELIVTHLQARTEHEAVAELCDRLAIAGRIDSPKAFIADVFAREAQGSTYCGHEVAIPHAVSTVVRVPSIAFGRTSGLAWGPDQDPVRFVILLAICPHMTDSDRNRSHVDILTAVAELALDPNVRERWHKAEAAGDIFAAMQAAFAGPA